MLEKKFEPHLIESSLYSAWEQSGAFNCQPQSHKTPYTIMMPPPNVTGSLHVGHALTYTLQDILVRFKRMLGFDVLWQPGTDHAGIATQMVVERQLAAQGVTRKELGRSQFLEKIWAWKQESGNIIVSQQKRLGISPDWARACFTMDEDLSQAVTKVFVDLYNEGLIYKDKRLVNWDPKLQTAVSDLEVLSETIKGSMWYINYPLVDDPSTFITVATTRPETLFGDTAVAVHPKDARYAHLIGKQVHLPLTNRQIPVVGDDYCDPEKGTGAVKITPAHDFNDFDVGKRHNLPLISILDSYGCLNTSVPKEFQGLPYEEARKRVVNILTEQDLLLKIEPITHTRPYGERSGVEIQPCLTDQWFLDAHTLAQPALKAVQEGETTFVPEFWSSTYFEWLTNIQPWCISRQLWWGHQIPAWYGPDGHIFVAPTVQEATAQALNHYGKPVFLKQDEDVLDTWFSSALWPFSTLGWPTQTPELNRYYPSAVLDTGFDIIFFWVARMMMMGLHFMKKVPFKTVYIHALVRDEKGAKMSKSKGNVIDPIGLLDKFGCDSVRFTLASLAIPGRDLKLGEPRIEGSRNFMTKIWNAARYLELNQCTYESEFNPTSARLIVNQWIIHECARLAKNIYGCLENYRFDEAASVFYQFFWGTYCDYYLEFLKPLLSGSEDIKISDQTEARQTAAWVFVNLLKMAHPFIPFITETLWASFTKEGLLIAQEWPKYGREEVDNSFSYPAAAKEISWVVDLISQVRSRRAEFNVPAATFVSLQLHDHQEEIKKRVDRHRSVLMRLCRLSDLTLQESEPEKVKGAIQFLVENTIAVLPLANAIDVEGERQRLQKDLEKLGVDHSATLKKLSNADFMAKAKPEIIEEMQQRVIHILSRQEKIQQALSRLL